MPTVPSSSGLPRNVRPGQPIEARHITSIVQDLDAIRRVISRLPDYGVLGSLRRVARLVSFCRVDAVRVTGSVVASLDASPFTDRSPRDPTAVTYDIWDVGQAEKYTGVIPKLNRPSTTSAASVIPAQPGDWCILLRYADSGDRDNRLIVLSEELAFTACG
ncbi:MAG: hypothetical protein EBZ59_10495 [Planctomycetia bacterium]|nr:hypothetical protein [Planctomycetia bacterium]